LPSLGQIFNAGKDLVKKAADNIVISVTAVVVTVAMAVGITYDVNNPQKVDKIVSGGTAAASTQAPKVDDKTEKIINKAPQAVTKGVQIYEKNINHIFREAPGHIADTSQNRKLLIDVTSDIKNFLGKDQYGNEWYARIEIMING